MRPHPLATVVVVGALAGLVFSSFATYDFAQHLDRQVHSLHCSFVPGLGDTDATGTSGCQVTLMSPYSSVFRDAIWGGIPISLPAMSVFAFLAFFALEIVVSRRQNDPRATGFLALATCLPAGASIAMATISFGELGAACKLCVGIYVASAACTAGAVALWRRAAKHASLAEFAAAAPPAPEPAPAAGGDPAWASPPSGDEATMLPEQAAAAEPPRPPERPARVGMGYLAAAFGVGVLFVAIPAIVYASSAPDHSRFVGACGSLDQPEDRYGVMVPLDPNPGGIPSVEILDPLCPACRGFEDRLEASDLGAELDRRALLFPLDDTCNWMVSDAVHPGACAVSRAVLCADERASEVVDWAFAEQERIRQAEAAQQGAAEEMVERRFPDLSACVGSPKTKQRLNKSLRWAVSNELPVLTPQLYVDGVKLCDEDTDLGMEFALTEMIRRHRAGTLTPGGDQ